MIVLEAYGALANTTGDIAGFSFVDGQLRVSDKEAAAAIRILTRFHSVRVASRQAYKGDRRDPRVPGRRATDWPDIDEEVEGDLEEAITPQTEKEQAPAEVTAPVIMRPLEEEVLGLERRKLEALVEGSDAYLIDRLLKHERANEARPKVLEMLEGAR